MDHVQRALRTCLSHADEKQKAPMCDAYIRLVIASFRAPLSIDKYYDIAAQLWRCNHPWYAKDYIRRVPLSLYRKADVSRVKRACDGVAPLFRLFEQYYETFMEVTSSQVDTPPLKLIGTLHVK